MPREKINGVIGRARRRNRIASSTAATPSRVRKHCPAGQDEKVAAKMSAQFLEITGVDVRMLPRQIHFAHDRSAVSERRGDLFASAREMRLQKEARRK